MKLLSLTLTAALLASTGAYAQFVNPSQMPPAQPAQEAVPEQPAVPVLLAITDNVELDADIRSLQHEWARIKYAVKDGDQQEAQMETLAAQAEGVTAKFPNYAEPKIWQAIILSTQAGINGGLGALGLCKDAKALLEQAEKINPKALDGSIYTSLGSLYYKVPAWPVGFGDNDKARAYLEQARAINPNGIDPNYFYGDFLIEEGKYAEAVAVLNHALQAAPRPGREDADAGRRQEIQAAIAKAQAEGK